MQTDAQLVSAVLAGDKEAYAHLVRRYEGAVRATGLAILRDAHAADDAAQTAFVDAYRRHGGAHFRQL